MSTVGCWPSVPSSIYYPRRVSLTVLTSALAPAPASVNVLSPPQYGELLVREWTVTNGFMRPGNSYSTKAHKMGDHNEGQGLRDSGPLKLGLVGGLLARRQAGGVRV